MGLTDKEKEERTRYIHENIKITKASDKKPYVFVSYKSDDWRDVFENVISKLQRDYHLRIYCDRDFETNNDSWLDTMRQQLQSGYCRGVLAFFSENYISSYAALLEILTAQTDETADYTYNEDVVEIIPVFLGDGNSFTEYRKRILYRLPDKCNIQKTEWDRFQECFREGFEKSNLNVGQLEKIQAGEDLLIKNVVKTFQDIEEKIAKNKNKYMNSDSFVRNLYETIKSVDEKAGGMEAGSVFESETKMQKNCSVKEEVAPLIPVHAKKEEEKKPEIKEKGDCLAYMGAVAKESDGRIVVLKGSLIKKVTVKSCSTGDARRREEAVASGKLKLQGERYILTEDMSFSSKSAAAAFVSGRSVSGNQSWKATSVEAKDACNQVQKHRVKTGTLHSNGEEITDKKSAILFLEQESFDLNKNITYAKYEDHNDFWANPNRRAVEEDWWIILNDKQNRELTLLLIPTGKIRISENHSNGLILRTDERKRDYINLHITRELVDRISGIDFNPYLVGRYTY